MTFNPNLIILLVVMAAAIAFAARVQNDKSVKGKRKSCRWGCTGCPNRPICHPEAYKKEMEAKAAQEEADRKEAEAMAVREKIGSEASAFTEEAASAAARETEARK